MTNPDNRILSNYATFSQKTKGRMIFEIMLMSELVFKETEIGYFIQQLSED